MKPEFPLAYFVTFSCYGTHLHGSEDGSVDRAHNVLGTPVLTVDEKRLASSEKRMKQTSYLMDVPRARVVLSALKETSALRRWNLVAAHVRSTHVHVVIQAQDRPERIMNDLKSYASRALSAAGFDGAARKRWTRHGSTRYIWNTADLQAAVQYVVKEQGAAMGDHEGGVLYVGD